MLILEADRVVLGVHFRPGIELAVSRVESLATDGLDRDVALRGQGRLADIHRHRRLNRRPGIVERDGDPADVQTFLVATLIAILIDTKQGFRLTRRGRAHVDLHLSRDVRAVGDLAADDRLGVRVDVGDIRREHASVAAAKSRRREIVRERRDPDPGRVDAAALDGRGHGRRCGHFLIDNVYRDGPHHSRPHFRLGFNRRRSRDEHHTQGRLDVARTGDLGGDLGAIIVTGVENRRADGDPDRHGHRDRLDTRVQLRLRDALEGQAQPFGRNHPAVVDRGRDIVSVGRRGFRHRHRSGEDARAGTDRLDLALYLRAVEGPKLDIPGRHDLAVRDLGTDVDLAADIGNGARRSNGDAIPDRTAE